MHAVKSVHGDDSEIDWEIEAARCERYGWQVNRTVRETRRRLFWGSLLADDSLTVLQALAAEGYGVYHTMVFVESNTTQMLTPRQMRFVPGSEELAWLKQLFGPTTNVVVEQYFDYPGTPDGMVREFMQRDVIHHAWKRLGMREDDVAVLSDVDETWSRDVLRAAQICDVEQFQPGQSCHLPKLAARSLIFEMSPECLVWPKTWYHPDMVVGECIEGVGNQLGRLRAVREHKGWAGQRIRGMGFAGHDDYELLANASLYPLWSPTDMRTLSGNRYGSLPRPSDDAGWVHTAYHFHNFFDTDQAIDVLRHKYKTYGHPLHDALTAPLVELHADLNFSVRCLLDLPIDDNDTERSDRLLSSFGAIQGPKPAFFVDDQLRRRMHAALRRRVEEDIEKHKKD